MPSFLEEQSLKKAKLSGSDDSWDADDPSECDSISNSEKGEENITDVPETSNDPVETDINVSKVEIIESANFFIEELSSDDEILTFQCPDDVDVKTLLNAAIGIKKPTKIKLGNKELACQIIENEKETLTCLVPRKGKNAAIVKLPVAGHIHVTECCKEYKTEVDAIQESPRPVLEIKHQTKRHPLLGSNWKEHLNTVKQQIKIQKKLLRISMRHEKSLEKAERKRKAEKRKLKDELSELKKRQKMVRH